MPGFLTFAQEYLRFARVLPAVLGLTFLWTWESLRPLARGRNARLRHAALNLMMAGLNGLLLFFTLGLVTTLTADWTAATQFGVLHALDLHWGWRLLAGFFVLDGWTYIWHLANHQFSFLWRFHRLHHSDTDMDCTTSARFHVGELALAACTRLPVIVLFGLEPVAILIHETVLVAVAQFHHANIDLGCWDRPLCWLIVTPNMHKVHHSRRRPETNSNFASILSIWDRLGRSFRWLDPAMTHEFGLDDFVDPHWQSLRGMLATPLAASHPNGQDR